MRRVVAALAFLLAGLCVYTCEIPAVCEARDKLFRKVCGRTNRCREERRVEDGGRISAVYEEEGRELSGSLDRGIVGVGNKRKNVVPVPVVRMDVHRDHVG